MSTIPPITLRGGSKAACLLVLALPPQEVPPANQPGVAQTSGSAAAQPTPSLHQAWLSEVMDLDHERAVSQYRAILADRQPDNLERWVAAARLLELQRLGRSTAPRFDPAEVPPPLRNGFANARRPLPVAELQLRAAALLAITPAAPTAATDSERLPPLRPIVAEAEGWLLGQIGPSWRDRFRQRQLADRPQVSERLQALRVLIAELEDRRSQADRARELYFTQWQAPAGSGDVAADLERVRRNLASLQRERGTSFLPTSVHQRLTETLEQLAATDPKAALNLVLRLPSFAELLLREPVAEGR